MRSNTPWSGAYQVQSAVWAVAQTTQFTEPGWQYLDASSAYFDPATPSQGSYVSLRSPDGGDWSTVIENIGTTEPRTVALSVTGGLTAGDLHVWQTTAEESFAQQADLVPAADGTYTLTIPADSSVTVTTTTGQGHGDAAGRADSAFPFPYHDSLSDGGPSGQTPYFSQMEGAYEERQCEGGREGTCLTQVSLQPAISWAAWKKPAGIIGDLDWSDYSATVQAFVPDAGTAQVLGRVSNDAMQPVPNGYGLSLAADGTWSLSRGVPGGRSSLELATGKIDGAGRGLARALALLRRRGDHGRDRRRAGRPGHGCHVDLRHGRPLGRLLGDPVRRPRGRAARPDPRRSTTRTRRSRTTASGSTARRAPGATTDAPGSRCRRSRAAGDGTISGSNRAGDAVTVAFDGTQATLVGVAGPRGGQATASIDGNEPVALSFREQGEGGEVVWRTPVLIDGAHTLRVEVVSDDPGNRGWVGLDRVEVVQARGGASSVDDQSEGSGGGRLDYQGSGWLSCPGASTAPGSTTRPSRRRPWPATRSTSGSPGRRSSSTACGRRTRASPRC